MRLFSEKGVAGRSQVGGTPFLPRGEESPTCARCGQLRELFLQLDSPDPPPGASWVGGGVMQVFYCSRCDGDIEG